MGAGHSHAADLQPASREVRRVLAIALGVFALLVLFGLVRLWPTDFALVTPTNDLAKTENVNATIDSVELRSCGPGSRQSCYVVRARADSGPDAGQTVDLPQMQADGSGAPPGVGEKVVLSRVLITANGQVAYSFSGYQRTQPLWALTLLFAFLVIAVARWKGLAAIGGLAITWFVLVGFLIPAILNGESPVAVALVSAALIIFVVLYIAHGVNARTTIALLGTLVSLAATGVLALVFVGATRLSGLASEEAAYIKALDGSIDVKGLLLAGIIIGTIGVLTDITVTQADVVWEVHAVNPSLRTRALYAAGLRTGRHHIASTVYTLVLAYAGASLPLLLLFVVAKQNVADVITGEVIAEEVVRTLLGSIGLVLSVPLTTLLAAFVVSRSSMASGGDHADSHDHPHGASHGVPRVGGQPGHGGERIDRRDPGGGQQRPDDVLEHLAAELKTGILPSAASDPEGR